MLQTKDKNTLLQFLKDWSLPMKQLLNARFGKGKIAHIIIAISTDNEPTITYTTNLRDGDFKRAMRILSDRVNESKIIKLND